VFREFHLANLFNKNYGDNGFYNGEEANLTDEEHSEPAREEEGKFEEPRWDEIETLGTTQTTKVITINPPAVSVALRN
jgi:hypothetical protein